MENETFTSKQYFTSLTVIHAALVLGQLLFAIISVFLNQTSEDIKDEADLFTIILVPALLGAGIIVGSLISQNKLAKIKEESSLGSKLQEYRTILIIKFALVEGPVLFGIVQYLITANYYFLLFAAAGIVYMVFVRPSKIETIKSLKLSTEEKDQLNDPNQVIN